MTTLRQPFDTTQDRPIDNVQDNTSVDRSTPPQDMSAKDEALHQQGHDHLQAGEWEEAVECFSKLAERHPDQEYYASLLKQARLKARLDEHRPRRRTGRSVARSRRVWALTMLALVIWLAVLGRQLYEQQIVPALEQREVITRQQQLLQEGRQLVAAGEIDQAAMHFKEVLALNPDNVVAYTALEEINKRQQLAQTYDNAMTLIEQEKWEPALAALESIRRESPGFRDVQQQIEQVEKLQTQANAFQKATQSFRSSDWQRAVEQLLSLRREAPHYKPEAVAQLLVESYMKQAETTLSDLNQNPDREMEQLRAVIGFFAKVLEVDPSNTEAALQSELAQEYLASLEAYHRGSWESASIHLTNIYPIAPDYANGRAAELLQTAYVQAGNEYRRQEEYEQAAERYRQAIALGLAGDARPAPKETEVLLQAADNLIRQSRYQAATATYGDILRMMGFEGVAGSTNESERDELAWQQPTTEPVASSVHEEPGRTETRPVEEAGVKPEPTPTAELYIVRPNDTLSGIAQRFNTTVTALVEANDIIQDPNLIRPGWQLLIPRS